MADREVTTREAAAFLGVDVLDVRKMATTGVIRRRGAKVKASDVFATIPAPKTCPTCGTEFPAQLPEALAEE